MLTTEDILENIQNYEWDSELQLVSGGSIYFERQDAHSPEPDDLDCIDVTYLSADGKELASNKFMSWQDAADYAAKLIEKHNEAIVEKQKTGEAFDWSNFTEKDFETIKNQLLNAQPTRESTHLIASVYTPSVRLNLYQQHKANKKKGFEKMLHADMHVEIVVPMGKVPAGTTRHPVEVIDLGSIKASDLGNYNNLKQDLAKRTIAASQKHPNSAELGKYWLVNELANKNKFWEEKHVDDIARNIESMVENEGLSVKDAEEEQLSILKSAESTLPPFIRKSPESFVHTVAERFESKDKVKGNDREREKELVRVRVRGLGT